MISVFFVFYHLYLYGMHEHSFLSEIENKIAQYDMDKDHYLTFDTVWKGGGMEYSSCFLFLGSFTQLKLEENLISKHIDFFPWLWSTCDGLTPGISIFVQNPAV